MRHKNIPASAISAQRNRRALTIKMNNFFEGDAKFSDTGTWPVKRDKKKLKVRKIRPLTATLDKPRLLDIALIGKIDMSRMTKELLSIYRIMRKPIKRASDEENQTPTAEKEDKSPKMTVTPIVWQRRGLEKFRRAKLDEVFSGPVEKPLVKPCDSCGRESRPERLHAHPPTSNIVNKKTEKLDTSAKSRQSVAAKPPEKPSLTPEKQVVKAKPLTKKEVAMGVPLMCSYCGKRFGSASLAIHEAKCKDKLDSDGSGSSPTRRSSSPRRPLDHQKTPPEEPKKPPQLNTQLTVPVSHSPRPGLTSPRNPSPEIKQPKGRIAPVSSPEKSPKANSEFDDYIFRANGQLDCEATFHNMWASHLRSLVLCQVCGRSFAPERIEKHQGVCNGSTRRLPVQKNR